MHNLAIINIRNIYEIKDRKKAIKEAILNLKSSEMEEWEPASPKGKEAGNMKTDQTMGATCDEREDTEKEQTTFSQEDLKKLKDQASKSEEYFDRLQRQVAEADNLRKRLSKEKQEAIRYANETLIEQLLPTMDSFEMAVNATQNSNENSIESLKTGIEMVRTQLKLALEEVGLSEIDAVGKVFDPSCHEAVSRHHTSEFKEGEVVEQIRKGYQLHDRLLRPASVVVAVPVENSEEKSER